MTFIDQEVKDVFQQAPPLLAVIVAHFEWECAKYHGQVECASADDTCAGLIVTGLKAEQLVEVCLSTNRVFPRHDSRSSCHLESMSPSLVVCLATRVNDLKNVL